MNNTCIPDRISSVKNGMYPNQLNVCITDHVSPGKNGMYPSQLNMCITDHVSPSKNSMKISKSLYFRSCYASQKPVTGAAGRDGRPAA